MKPEYYTVPPIESVKPTLRTPVIVEDLQIGRYGHGHIVFPGKTNLQGIDLDSIVHINHGSVEVYPDECSKPPVGNGLNKSAVITLYNVWQKGERTSTDFKRNLVCATRRMGAEFLEYCGISGSWTFRVSHFSKYGLNDSDEEGDAQVNVQQIQNAVQVARQNTAASKGAPNNQNMQIVLITRPVPLDSEETIAKALFYDQSYNEDDENMNQTGEPQLNHLNNMNQLSSANVMSPSQSILNFTLNNERLYGLKASLFEDDCMEEEEYIEPIIDPIPATWEHKRRKEESSTMLSVRMPSVDRSTDLPLIQPAPIDSPIFRTPRRNVTAMQFSEAMPYEKSLIFEKNNFLLDAGCFKGPSFRVGWGPRMCILHKATLQEPSVQEPFPKMFSLLPLSSTASKPSPPPSLSTIQYSMLDMSSISSSVYGDRGNFLVNLLVQLSHKELCIVDGVPKFSPRNSIELLNSHFILSEQQASQSTSLQDAHTVWSLCSALWGHCQEEESPNSYNYHLFRKERVSDWLISSTSSTIKKEVGNSTIPFATIFSLLTGNSIAEAGSKALEENNLRLGLLLLQAGSSGPLRRGILRQLENWFQFEVDKFINRNCVKIYALMAGKLVWETRQGTTINCCEDLDWKRALSLHLWYHCLPTASIQEVLQAYEEAFRGSGPNGQYASFPYPPYIENNHELLLLAGQNDTTPLDMCYYLLKLYCDRTTPLGKMLVPLTYGRSQLDYSLSWMIHEVLLSLGYNHLPSPQTQMLHLNFASQLESVGLWEWAVFVLLHISDAAKRKSLVMEVIMRHVSLKPSEKESEIESFLKDKLHIPSSWIYAAKAVLAKSVGNYKEEAWCLIKSSQWPESHRIIIENIAPDCIIHEQFDYLKSFLIELSSPEVSSTILGWSTGGEVYLDYIHVSQIIEEMLGGQAKAYEIEELHPKLISLSNRICSLQCLDAKGRLCQSEMSKKTVTLFRALLTLRNDTRTMDSSINYELASLLPRLPMPEDYALQELRAMVRSYMLEVTNTIRNYS